jgi:hypothetical protein
MNGKLTPEQQLRNVAAIAIKHTEITRHYNGRGRCATYAADVDAIASTARQLAEMILQYLDGTRTTIDPSDLPF